jgi:ferredoxin-NADP reductase
MGNETVTYKVCEMIDEAPSVKTIKLVISNGALPNYEPGQFITVYFPDAHTDEGKGYSISSAPSEPTLNITVKAIGEFSRRLCNLQPGDTLTGSKPYGFFFSESADSPLVMIAAGIGIAPFRSMITGALSTNVQRPIHLFYSNQTTDNMVFAQELNGLSHVHNQFVVHHFITRQQDLPEGVMAHRITAQDIISQIESLSIAEFLVCGSIAFVRDMWRGLIAAGVDETMVYTESFY